MQIETKIDGLTVSLDTDMDQTEDGEKVSGCWVNSGRYTASLQLLQGTGELESEDGTLPVSNATIKKITDWAVNNGFEGDDDGT